MYRMKFEEAFGLSLTIPPNFVQRLGGGKLMRLGVENQIVIIESKSVSEFDS